MKTKVIKYNYKDEVVEKVVELEKISEYAYFDNEEGDAFLLVNGLFVCVGWYSSIDIIKNNVDKCEELAKNYIKNSLLEKYPKKIFFRVFEKLGLSTEKLSENLLLFNENKQKDEEEKREKKELEAREQHLKKVCKINSDLAKLKAGENITFNELLDILDHLKISIHPRTKGTISKQGGNWINLKEGLFDKKTGRSFINGVFELIKSL